jgi:hypothetical protein
MKGMRRLLDLGWIYRRDGEECRIICIFFVFVVAFLDWWEAFGCIYFMGVDTAWMDALVVWKIRTDARDGLHMYACM